MDASPSFASYTPQLMRVATQVRSLGLVGKKVTLFAPVGSISGADGLVQKVADALSALDRTPILIINVKDVPSDSMATFPPAEESEAGNDHFYINHAEGYAGNGRESGKPISHINALAIRSADTLPVVITRARGQIGYVFVDAPAVVDSAATSLAAAYADAVVLIVQKGTSLQREIEAAKQQFLALGAHIVGFIFIE